jgi:deferrochelatase/peroxidase EfeB
VPEIHQELGKRGVVLAERTVTNLIERYEELVALRLTDHHRLLRRARTYTADGERGTERGLVFMCLVGDLSRQYEFVQHSWINDPVFDGLHDGPDPLVAPRADRGGSFVEPALPLRRRHRGLPEFVRMRGGAYFFLPGVSALRYLAQLPQESR